MFKCSDIESRIADYLYAELGAAEKKKFEKHLALCPSCTANVKALLATRRIMGRLEDAEAPELSGSVFAEAALALASAGQQRKPWQHYLSHPAFASVAIAASVLAVVSTYYLTDYRKYSPPQPPALPSLAQRPEPELMPQPPLPDMQAEQPRDEIAQEPRGLREMEKLAEALRERAGGAGKAGEEGAKREQAAEPDADKAETAPKMAARKSVRAAEAMDQVGARAEAKPKAGKSAESIAAGPAREKETALGEAAHPAEQAPSQPPVVLKATPMKRPRVDALPAAPAAAASQPVEAPAAEAKRESATGQDDPAALASTGKCNESVAAIEKAARDKEQAADLYMQAARCFERAGDTKIAVELYNSIADMFPSRAQEARSRISRLSEPPPLPAAAPAAPPPAEPAGESE